MKTIVEEMEAQQTIKKDLLDLYIEWSLENWGAIRVCDKKAMDSLAFKMSELIDKMSIDKIADIIDDLTFINATNEQTYRVLEALGYEIK